VCIAARRSGLRRLSRESPSQAGLTPPTPPNSRREGSRIPKGPALLFVFGGQSVHVRFASSLLLRDSLFGLRAVGRALKPAGGCCWKWWWRWTRNGSAFGLRGGILCGSWKNRFPVLGKRFRILGETDSQFLGNGSVFLVEFLVFHHFWTLRNGICSALPDTEGCRSSSAHADSRS
jgi:hypothetical protein